MAKCLNPPTQPDINKPRVLVAGFPSSDRGCCHQIFAQHGEQLKKLDLASTRRVEVRQPFQAEAGDRLSFDCVVLLKSDSDSSPTTNVQAVVVNLKTQTTDVLLDRTIGWNAQQLRIGSRSREPLSLSILAAGKYELRTITTVDPMCPGAEAHLMVDSVRLTDAFGAEKRRLASLSCVGRHAVARTR